MAIVSLIRLDAGNDRNGNPRRCYVALNETCGVAGVWDEGYDGYRAVSDKCPIKAHTATTFRTTPAEYASLVRDFAGQTAALYPVTA